MYLDRQLWAFTTGVRLRILVTVFLGLLAVSAGIARLALLGWLLGRVLGGAPLASLVGLAAAVALAIGLRGAPRLHPSDGGSRHGCPCPGAPPPDGARAQLTLGPAHFTAVRTGDVILSVVEGVQQLGVYFGQYCPSS
jgi:ATP-binding cassette subfamily C protein CydCD